MSLVHSQMKGFYDDKFLSGVLIYTINKVTKNELVFLDIHLLCEYLFKERLVI